MMQKKTTFIIFLVLIALVGGVFLKKKGSEDVVDGDVKKIRSVATTSVKELSSELSPLSLTGEVRAVSRADIVSEVSGRVLAVHATLGEFVTGGSLIVEMENDAEKTELLQAEANLHSAEASLQKIRSGARDEERSIVLTEKTSSEERFTEARGTLVDALRSSYISADDAVRSKTDPLFTDPRSENPRLNFTVNNFQLETDILRDRVLVEAMLDKWEERTRNLAKEENLPGTAEELKDDLSDVQFFIDNLALAINSAPSSTNLPQATIDGWKADVSLARTALSASRTALVSAQEIFSVREGALSISKQRHEEVLSGARAEDIRQAEALVSERAAALLGAKLRLEKTFLRAPISGTIDTLSATVGEFTPALSSIGSIANDQALEVVLFIASNDRQFFSPGTVVMLPKGDQGVVTKISPSIDARTRKVEVRISVSSGGDRFLHGEFVRVLVPRSPSAGLSSLATFVPLSALKITASGTFVFSISENSTLVAHKVVVKNIYGGKAEIDGISIDLSVVTDSRGMSEGEDVVLE